MTTLFYLAGAVAVLATVMMLTRYNAVHALLYLVVSLAAVAVVFYTLGAPFVALLELIVYAGAIVVLLLFVVMMLNLGDVSIARERGWISAEMWIGPLALGAILVGLSAYAVFGAPRVAGHYVGPQRTGVALFTTYVIGVQLAGMLLLAALVGAFHLGSHRRSEREVRHDADTHGTRTDTGGDFVRPGAGGRAGTP